MKISAKCQGAPQNSAIFKHFCPSKSAALHPCLFPHYCVSLAHCFPVHWPTFTHFSLCVHLWLSFLSLSTSVSVSVSPRVSVLPFLAQSLLTLLPSLLFSNIYYTMLIESHFEYLFRTLLASQDLKI